MEILKLNFINPNPPKGEHPIEDILIKYGEAIGEYTKGVFSYIVTSGGNEGVSTTFSLYILVPEIGYNYQVLSLNMKDVETVSLHYFTLKTQQSRIEEIKIDAMRNNYTAVDPVVKRLLETPLANETYKFLYNQVLMKRESRAEKFDSMED
jgi:hypothetical protein